MDLSIVEVGTGLAVLAFAALQVHQRMPRLRIQVFPCRADGTYARGAGGWSHLSCEVLNTGRIPIVLRGVGFASRIRVRPDPGESATLSQELVYGERPIDLLPGHSSRFVVPLGRAVIDLEHELESIWAQSTMGRRFSVSAREVLWVQEELFHSYCLEHAA